jgi:DNA topoisomerase VI B subunit
MNDARYLMHTHPTRMALIWSKKSTGVPITIKTSHVKSQDYISTCVLDIDIYKNEPKVIEHTKEKNTDGWKGTEFQVIIAGSFSSYKARIVQYLQQLAIITPYAKIEMQYTNRNDQKKDMTIRYDRRSEQMPPPAREVKHHPSSVNNLLVQQLVDKTNCKTLLKFLCDDLSGVSPSIAKRVIKELGKGFDENMKPSMLDGKQITRFVQLLRSVELFKAPDGSCLSPLGEYNLNLGIRKVIEPDIVATARDKASAYEGHPFIVEAAISLGGKSAKEGINVIRFANRIPLLFEAGADVCTRVAQSKIKWSSYKIDHKKDKISVFVSIVSTKVPFKGTGKEYIGDDITEIQTSVKRALQSCCQQLRSQLTKRNALRDAQQRKNRLVKYIPDATRSIFGILDTLRKRKAEEDEGEVRAASPRKIPRRPGEAERVDIENTSIIQKLNNDIITEDIIQACLVEAVELQGGPIDGVDGAIGIGKGSKKDIKAQPTFLVPIQYLDDGASDIHHELFVFRPMNRMKSLA